MTALMLAALIAAGAAGQAAPPPPVNRCVACHLAASRPAARIHLADWSQSVHARSAVTCDRCHGGDPSATDLARAHRGVVESRYATSRVSRQNLPATCGECHTPQSDAFRNSAHYTLVEQNLRLGPVCSDCHGAAAATLPRPPALEALCARCHVAESVGTARPRLARQALQDVEFVRALLQRTARAIEREPDLARYERLQRERREARMLLTSAIDALHTFNLRDVSERLLRTREAAEALVDELAPHASPPAATPDPRRTEPLGDRSLLIRSVYGPDLFRAYCSDCHGRAARGRGTETVGSHAPDLTALARRRSAGFPRDRVTAILTGQITLPGHAPSDMPIWGPIFQALDPRDRWTAIRIENLVDYLESIQR